MVILAKKVSWTILIFLFVFDNLFSYYAITQLGAHEANLLIAPYVEAYPWLYFFCVPATVVIIGIIVVIIGRIVLFLLNSKVKKDILERIILTALVIYWTIANSSLNLAFLLGHKQSIPVWRMTTAVGITLALVYAVPTVVLSSKRR